MNVQTDSVVVLNGYDLSMENMQDYLDRSFENAIMNEVFSVSTNAAANKPIDHVDPIDSIGVASRDEIEFYTRFYSEMQELYNETMQCFNVELCWEKPNFYTEKTVRWRPRERRGFMKKLSNSVRADQRRKLNQLAAHGNTDGVKNTLKSLKKTSKLKTKARKRTKRDVI